MARSSDKLAGSVAATTAPWPRRQPTNEPDQLLAATDCPYDGYRRQASRAPPPPRHTNSHCRRSPNNQSKFAGGRIMWLGAAINLRTRTRPVRRADTGLQPQATSFLSAVVAITRRLLVRHLHRRSSVAAWVQILDVHRLFILRQRLPPPSGLTHPPRLSFPRTTQDDGPVRARAPGADQGPAAAASPRPVACPAGTGAAAAPLNSSSESHASLKLGAHFTPSRAAVLHGLSVIDCIPCRVNNNTRNTAMY